MGVGCRSWRLSHRRRLTCAASTPRVSHRIAVFRSAPLCDGLPASTPSSSGGQPTVKGGEPACTLVLYSAGFRCCPFCGSPRCWLSAAVVRDRCGEPVDTSPQETSHDGADPPARRDLGRRLQRRLLGHVHAQVEADQVEADRNDHALEPGVGQVDGGHLPEPWAAVADGALRRSPDGSHVARLLFARRPCRAGSRGSRCRLGKLVREVHRRGFASCGQAETGASGRASSSALARVSCRPISVARASSSAESAARACSTSSRPGVSSE
jgi:hypothetical protein